MMEKIPCSVEILTRNSSETLDRCLESVRDFSDIIVLDGNSTDDTPQIAARYGARVIPQYDAPDPLVPISDFARVRNKGLGLAREDWFMYIDSDEYLSPEAVEEIRNIVTTLAPGAYVWWQPRRYVLDGRIIRCATTYPNCQIRLFHKKWVRGFIKPIHERIEPVLTAKIGILKSYEYVPLGPLESLRSRWARYMDMETDMVRNASFPKKIKFFFRYTALFFFYTGRYARNFFFCRGSRMPFSYEWGRHVFLLKFAWRIVKTIPGR